MTFTPMQTVLKPGQLGPVRLQYNDITEVEARFTELRAVVTQNRDAVIPPGRYCQLYVGSTLMMSDTPMEQRSNFEVVRKAKGDVLIAGLGIGMILLPILAKPQVKSVTVVEKSEEVVNLVAPAIMEREGGQKLTVVHGDINTWEPSKGSKWHIIYFDIWPTINTDNLDEMDVLHARFKPNLRKGGWMDSWKREHLLWRERMRGE